MTILTWIFSLGLVSGISSFFWMPIYRKSIIKKADPKLLERIQSMSVSGGLFERNKQIQTTLTNEGYDKKEIGRAMAANVIQKQNRNFRLSPILSILISLGFFAKIFLPENNIGNIIDLLFCIAIIILFVRDLRMRKNGLNTSVKDYFIQK